MFNGVSGIRVVKWEPVFSSNSKCKIIPSAKKVLEPPPPLPQPSTTADMGKDNTGDGLDWSPTLPFDRETGHRTLIGIPIIW